VVFVGEELILFGFVREEYEKNYENHCCNILCNRLGSVMKQNVSTAFC